MIPKIIHYCWFGNGEMSHKTKKCISSWKKHCPDYEIRQWDETNFDTNSNDYIRQAYESGMYAFVSDYARLFALYNFGGIYLDVDVEVLNNFDDILDNKGVFGFEQKEYIATSFMAVESQNPLIKDFMDLYESEVFKISDDTLNDTTNVVRLTNLLEKNGLVKDNTMQIIDGNLIYPKEYFSPYDYINCVDERTQNTYCIHWFEVSWLTSAERLKKHLKTIIVNLFGKKMLETIRTKVRR